MDCLTFTKQTMVFVIQGKDLEKKKETAFPSLPTMFSALSESLNLFAPMLDLSYAVWKSKICCLGKAYPFTKQESFYSLGISPLSHDAVSKMNQVRKQEVDDRQTWNPISEL